MNPKPLTFSPSYLAVARGLRELHQLTVKGRLDSPEADAVRDATDMQWEALTDIEKKRIGGLSEDLYSITDPPPTEVQAANSQVMSRLEEFFNARRNGEWDSALDLLRRWKDDFDPSMLSYFRGSIWRDAGDLEVATIFLKNALDRLPDDGRFLAAYLSTFNQIAPHEAEKHARKIISGSEDYTPIAVVSAANILIDPARQLPTSEAIRFFKDPIPVLESSLAKVENRNEAILDESVYVTACQLLGSCHEFLGEIQIALDYYSHGLAVSPTHVALLVSRGTLLYGENPLAIDDFKAAIQIGSSFVQPFFFLAHYSLSSGRYGDCRSYCERALELSAPEPVKSELAEWLAISQSMLGFPPDLVRRSFEAAIRHDLSNERARHNLAFFEAATRPVPENRYETRTKMAVRASGLAERRMQLVA